MPPTRTINRAGQKAANRIAEFRENVNNGATPAEARANVRAVEAGPQVTPLTNNEGAIDAATLRSGGAPNMPAPTAPTVAQAFQGGLQASVEGARTNLDTTLKTERDAALTRQDALNKQMQTMVKDSNPENRETFQQEQRIIQNQLNAAETAAASLEEDFNKRRAVVNELDTLLTQGNQLIEQSLNAPVSLSVLNKGVNNAAQAVQARAGVLQAVVAGLDGNVNAAHSIIENTRTAVAAQWQDQLDYNKTYMSLVESGQLAKNKINDNYANSQIVLAERKLNQLDATAKTITDLMIDPESAQFMADAGITLNDSVEEIQGKMAEQTKKQEIMNTKNTLIKEGYEYVPFPGDREDVVTLEIGGKTLSFVPPVDEAVQQLALQAQLDGAPSDVVVAMLGAKTVAEAAGLGGQFVGALDREAKRASINASNASTANLYDQILARSAALRQSQATATTEQDKLQIKATADTEQALGIKQLANELLTTDGLTAAIGVGFKKNVIGAIPFVSGDAVSGTNRVNFEAKATRLANLLTLDNLKLMSGVLTDRDIRFLADAGSNLGQFNLSEAAYKAEINRIIATMDRTISNNGMTTEQAVFFGVLEAGDAQSLDAIWDNL